MVWWRSNPYFLCMKIVQGGAVLLILLIGVGVWFFLSPKEEKTVSLEKNENTVLPPENGSSEEILQKPSMVRSIKEAMETGGQMRCTYTSGEGTAAVTSTVLVAGEQFYTQVVTSGVTTSALYDGKTQYVWTNGSTEGMKMTKACLEDLQASVPQDTTSQQAPSDYQGMLETALNVQCVPIETNPLETILPKEVVFSDQCAMMEQGKKMMEQYQDKIPADMSKSFPVQY